MKAQRERRFWFTRHAVNPLVSRILIGPMGRRLGGRLAVLRYVGRRTGQTRELVVQYARDGDRIWVVPARPDRKRWWRNLWAPQPVEVWLQGARSRGTARVLVGDEAIAALTRYRATFPKTAAQRVIVRIDLDRGGSGA